MFSETKLRLSAERLREVLTYAQETGLFTWRVSRGSVAAGSEAGNADAFGYRVIHIDGVGHRAHRLAWLYVCGEHPTGEIDHKNRNPADNRIANLRRCSRAENLRNTSRRNRQSGFKGVYRDRRKWIAQIYVDGRTFCSEGTQLRKMPPPLMMRPRVFTTENLPEQTKCSASCRHDLP